LYLTYAIYLFFSGGYDDGFETWNELIQEIQNNQ